jgi:ribosomal protein L1
MPNPKTGTVTNDIGKAVTEVKAVRLILKLTKQESFMHQLVKHLLMLKSLPKMQMNCSEHYQIEAISC